MPDLFISMRAADAATHFRALADEAEQAIERDGALEYRIAAEPNRRGPALTIIFNNDDMERSEMDGRTIVEVEDR